MTTQAATLGNVTTWQVDPAHTHVEHASRETNRYYLIGELTLHDSQVVAKPASTQRRSDFPGEHP